MFRQILIPLDGSACAEQVLPAATQLAHASGGSLTLLTVVDFAHEVASYPLAGPVLPPGTVEREFAAARSYQEQVAHRDDLVGIPLEKRVEPGNPAATILSYAHQHPIDLIVMASHGYTGVKRWLLGSVAEKIARHAPVPVFVIREEGSLHTHLRVDETRAVRALVPLDTSVRALDAIPPAAELVAALASPGPGQLHLTHILVAPEGANRAKQEALLREAGRHLEAIGQSIRDGLVANVGPELSLAFSWTVSPDREIAEGIVRIAECGEWGANAEQVERCDLIAMATHGWTGIHRQAVGSTTERVLHTTTLPLLIVRPADILEKERQQRECQTTAPVEHTESPRDGWRWSSSADQRPR